MTAWFWYCDPLIGVLDYYITEVRIYAHARLHQAYLAGSKRNALPVRILAISHDDDPQLVENVVRPR